MPPEVWEINQDAWALWLAVQTQWRAGGFGAVGLDYLAVEQEAGRMGIELSICNMKKIQALEREELEAQSAKGKAVTERK